MLFDPKWEVQTKPDVFSLESLIAWLEKQPGDMTYNWRDCHGECLIGIYFAASGIRWSVHEYINFLSYRTRSDIAGTEPHTFGAALSRARTASQGQG